MVQHDSSQFVIFASEGSADALRVLQQIKSFKPVFSTRLPKPIHVSVCKLGEMRDAQDYYGSSAAMTFNTAVLVTPDRKQIPCDRIVDFLQGVASAPRASPVRDETGRVVNDPRSQGYGGGYNAPSNDSRGGNPMRNAEDAFAAIGHAPTSDDPESRPKTSTSDLRSGRGADMGNNTPAEAMFDAPKQSSNQSMRDNTSQIKLAPPPLPGMSNDEMMRDYFRQVRITKAS